MSIPGKYNRGSLIDVLKNKLKNGPPPSSCTFCDIVQSDEKKQVIYRDTKNIIIKDIRPASKSHILVIPKDHVQNITTASFDIVTSLIETGSQYLSSNRYYQQVASTNDVLMGFHKPPYNSVYHLHLHIVYPISSMNGHETKRIMNPGWISVEDWISEDSKK